MKLSPDVIPTTIEDAVALMFLSLDDRDKEYIRTHPPESVHFSIGMWMRNNWGLWQKDSPLKMDFSKQYNLFGFADDITGIILELVWRKVRGEPEDVSQEVERCRQHWIKRNVDHVTGVHKDGRRVD